ncbi:LEAF RUST 10 DISEASE-RESISTANCE LOCUS RECEPTOR-LIKE PROTEIN KINASE-like 2.3 isoform X4 [Populus nigra]|uniref:LEAF RUST 10 DISEASE-RESISTANCE LOCUS RECEPTOR-LIKE PROTEIN KINASE-like 2.3 isoform X4 n=1 Tax=Populus nigra TaxID=3691 RepID=UPI002B271046|nr:LEAF RUST 10 DISEASE-RESISTANCE LOCUS RECEPTOR-LIKE PROTEIN KINASE-like 2.3 isoform X4 [Populus nigra]
MLLPLARMNSSAFSFLSIFVLVLLLFIQVPSSSSNDGLYTACSKKFECGGISADFPFWGNDSSPACGFPELKLRCENNFTKMNINQVAYRVLEINQYAGILRIAREDSFVGLCSPQFKNSTFNPKVFEYVEGYKNLTFIYGCKDAPTTMPFTCKRNEVNDQSGYIQEGECNRSVIVPVSITDLPPIGILPDLEELLKKAFEVRLKVEREACWECFTSKGACGIDDVTNQTTCYCPNQSRGSKTCARESSWSRGQLHIAVGISAAVAAIITFSVITICLTRRKGSFSAVIAKIIRPKNSQHVDSVETFMMDYHSLTPKRYSYSDIKKMTSSFVNILGQGGFGYVYRGKLPDDGRLVAVKVLKESKDDGEEFMNEVASISRTSHVNVVTLLGFCYERNKRALIYEFMPNGSLDSFISDKRSLLTNCRLEWKKLYEIAVGIARGLEYLHRGCNTRIVHFDIKPHNILLDEDFCPKISDFGLAKLCQSKVSKISMIGARGTVGYIAPEVFCRSFGGVTYKSDVYSYGMMVLEMVGQSKDFDMGSLETNEMYFPDWFYMYLEPGKISTLHGGITEEEEEIVEKMILVGLWCIQTIPSHRPSMTKVVEMFEGSLQSLQIPPTPSFSSPRRSAQEQSCTVSSLPCVSSQGDEVNKLPADESDL